MSLEDRICWHQQLTQSRLNKQAKQGIKSKIEKTLRIEIDEEAFDRLYGYESHPIAKVKGKKIAVRVVSQFGEESTLVRIV